MSWLPELPTSNKPRLWNLRSKYESEPALYSWLYDPTEDGRWYSHVPKEEEEEHKSDAPTPEPEPTNPLEQPKIDLSHISLQNENNMNINKPQVNSNVNEPPDDIDLSNQTEIELLDEQADDESDNETF